MKSASAVRIVFGDGFTAITSGQSVSSASGTHLTVSFTLLSAFPFSPDKAVSLFSSLSPVTEIKEVPKEHPPSGFADTLHPPDFVRLFSSP